MNRDLTNNRLSPTDIITVYRDGRPDSRGANYYLEKREVKTIGGKQVLMSAQPLADSVLRKIAGAYIKTGAQQMLHDKLIGAHILHASHTAARTTVLWYRPAHTVPLNFSERLLSVNKLAKKKPAGAVNYPVPATLYLVRDGELFIFALAGNQRPGAKTKIYCAPFFNIYHDGRVCLGTANVGKHKAKTFEGEAQRFEAGFYQAEQNGGDQQNACKITLPKLWPTLAGVAAFPVKQLNQHKFKTLGKMLEKLIGGGTNFKVEDWMNDEDIEEMRGGHNNGDDDE